MPSKQKKSQSPGSSVSEDPISAFANVAFLEEDKSLTPEEQLELDVTKILHCGALTQKARTIQLWWFGELCLRMTGEVDYSYTEKGNSQINTVSHKSLGERFGMDDAIVGRACALRRNYTLEDMLRYIDTIPKMTLIWAAQLPKILRFCYLNALERRKARGEKITIEDSHAEIRATRSNMGYHIVRSTPLFSQVNKRLRKAETQLAQAKDIYNNYLEEFDDFEREQMAKRLSLIQKYTSELKSTFGIG